MAAIASSRLPEILLVEDSPTDVLLTKQALDLTRRPAALHVVKDGIEALEFLRQQGPYGSVPRPDLILLDLNLPRKGGREVLREVKNDRALASIPIAVLSTSHAEADIRNAYESHANCYLVKPLSYERFAEMIRLVRDFWLAVVMPPPNPARGS